MKISQFLIEGGLGWMLSISTCGLVMLIFTIFKGYQIIIKKKTDHDQLNFILLFGSLSFIVGVLGTALGFSQVMHAISEMGNIAKEIIFIGLRLAMTNVIYGLFYFLISIICWGILKAINQKISKPQKG